MQDEARTLVTFRGVQKTYDGVNLVVRSLDLDIRQGEFLTLLGPSGSGKTTCLMMLAGFEVPTRGEIRLDGKRLNDVPPHKRNIGMVFQNYALFPHLTVRENIAYPLRVRRVGKTETASRVAHALDMVKLAGMAGRYPAQLSGGQQQRVALARALVFEPKLVLMDEPLGALDKQLREHMQLEIRHLHERLGVTVVYVTHDQSEALTLSDRVAVFHNGAIQQIDAPEKLYEEPANAFVAHFIGENNRLHGTLLGVEGDTARVRLAEGAQVLARAATRAAVGDAVTVSIRPERVCLAGAQDDCENRVTARIEEFIYLGDHLRLRATVCGNSEFIVKLPIARFAAGSMKVGESLEFGWRAQDARALDPE